MEQVAAIENQLTDGLAVCAEADGVVDVRIKGAIGVVQYAHALDVSALREQFVNEGVWVRPFRDIIYLAPPLVIGAQDLARLIDAINRVVLGNGKRAVSARSA